MISATFNYKSRVDILSDSKHRFNCHICSQNRNGATFILTRNVLITIIHIQINLNAKIKVSVLFVYENSRVDSVSTRQMVLFGFAYNCNCNSRAKFEGILKDSCFTKTHILTLTIMKFFENLFLLIGETLLQVLVMT